MRFKSIISLPVAFLFSTLHVACCILPLLVVASSSVTYVAFFSEYKPVFTIVQLFMLVYFLFRLARRHFLNVPFHSKLESVSYHISFLLSGVGLYIGYFEPFQSEKQQMAQQRLAYFKTHRRLELGMEGDYNVEKLRADVSRIEGIKPGRIHIEEQKMALTFQSDLVSESAILTALKEKGYVCTKIE
jgi:hypothetical protein